MEPTDLDGESDQDRIRQVREAVATWRSQLFDLGGRNQLLYYRDLKVGTLDLSDAAEATVHALLQGRTTRLSEMFDADVMPDRLKRARTIRNKSRELLEERGIATCFLAIGMATWTSTRGSATPASPIFLQQLAISARGAGEDDFDLSLTGELELNPALLQMLTREFKVSIAEEDMLAALPSAGMFTADAAFERLAKEAAGVPGFSANPRHVIGNFSYAKLPMVTDLEANEEALIAHDMIAAIAGNADAQITVAGIGQAVDPSHIDRTLPANEFLVLDADSSQSYAINAAAAGQSLVVSGPPGTGKSQTIANLIATLVARGESVLFVAEKRAAISAVLERLSRVGLDDLVLDIHDGVSSKRKVAENLAKALKSARSVGLPQSSVLDEQLVAYRNKLGRHAETMKRHHAPWEVSLFDVQSALVELDHTYGSAASTSERLPKDELATLDATTFRRLCDEMREYAGLGGLTINRDTSPWCGAKVFSSEQAESALAATRRLRTQTLPDTRRSMRHVRQEAGIREPDAVADWRALITRLEAVRGTFMVLDPAVFSALLPQMVAATAGRKWRRANSTWPGAMASWSERRRVAKSAAALWRGDRRPSRPQLHAALVTAARQQAEWATLTVDGGSPRVPETFDEVCGRYEQLIRELDSVSHYLGQDLAAQSPADLEARLDRLAHDERTLQKLPRIHALKSAFKNAGLGPLLKDMRKRRLDADLAVATLRYCWYASVLERIRFEDFEVANFDGSLHSDTANSYRSADVSHISGAASRVRRAAAERLTRMRDEHPQEGWLVEQQANRKKGHLPLRQLFAEAPNVMTALKPCWAMSPLVVSQQLPGDKPYFDVVIFDEASQIVPADAVPAILRAGRVIVAGDKHQLPPTSFFSSASADEDDIQVTSDDGTIDRSLTRGYESILDVLTGVLGERRICSLTWHYRSHDERLIAFSNAWIYDRSLKTFPGVAGEGCLSHVLVDQPAHAIGQEDSVSAEVNRVVELVIEHAATRPEESLGVITMGTKHADRIDEALRRARSTHPELAEFFDESRTERFFVKNLERVQGDERDAIILSVGYGKSADGRLPYRFGPLLQAGGERRLNVAVTRARSRMTLVSSFSHHDMDPARSSRAGVKMLRDYLQYAASGGTDFGETWEQKPSLNPFEISVRDRLLAAGIPVTPQYGVAGYWIDFAAAHPTQPGRMVLAIEADGATYHSSTSARDRDRLRQEQLERLGWTFHRIWSTDWFNDPETCVAKVRLAYDRAVAAADENTSHTSGQSGNLIGEPQSNWESDVSHVDPAPPRGPRPHIVRGLPINDYDPSLLVEVMHWIESDTLLRTEDELLSEFMSTLGLQRRGTRILEAFRSALKKARSTTKPRKAPAAAFKEAPKQRRAAEPGPAPTSWGNHSSNGSNRATARVPANANASSHAAAPSKTAARAGASAEAAKTHPTAGAAGIELEPYEEFAERFHTNGPASPSERIRRLRSILAVEGPMTGRRLHEVYIRAHGGRFAAGEDKSLLNSTITAAVRSRILVEEAPLGELGVRPRTYRLPGQPEARIRVLGPRSLEDVPPLELARLMAVMRDKGGWHGDLELYRAMVEILGGHKHLTSEITERLAKVARLIPVATQAGTATFERSSGPDSKPSASMAKIPATTPSANSAASPAPSGSTVRLSVGAMERLTAETTWIAKWLKENHNLAGADRYAVQVERRVMNETRDRLIRRLDDLHKIMKDSVIDPTYQPSSTVSPGVIAVIRRGSQSDVERVLLTCQRDPAGDVEPVSPFSALGDALSSAKVGQTLRYVHDGQEGAITLVAVRDS